MAFSAELGYDPDEVRRQERQIEYGMGPAAILDSYGMGGSPSQEAATKGVLWLTWHDQVKAPDSLGEPNSVPATDEGAQGQLPDPTVPPELPVRVEILRASTDLVAASAGNLTVRQAAYAAVS